MHRPCLTLLVRAVRNRAYISRAKRILVYICTSDTRNMWYNDPSKASLEKVLRRELSPVHKAVKALQHHRVGSITYRIKSQPYCDFPVGVERYVRSTKTRRGAALQMLAPCRKCEKCRRFRRLQWRDRIKTELQAHERNWFLTLTFSEVHLAGILAKAKTSKWDFETEAVEHTAYADVQRYLKRVRKACGKLRYFAVPEYGEEKGRLHYHLLIHELEHGRVTSRALSKHWYSFTDASLVKSSGGSAGYVSKYITKASTRPRASARYGRVVSNNPNKRIDVKPPTSLSSLTQEEGLNS